MEITRKDRPLMGTYELDALSLYFNVHNQRTERINYQVGEWNQFGLAPKSGGYEIIHPNVNQRAFYPCGLSVNPFRCYGFRFHPSNTAERFFELQESFEDLFTRIYHLGPRRRRSSTSTTTWDESRHPKDVGLVWRADDFLTWLSGRVRRRSPLKSRLLRLVTTSWTLSIPTILPLLSDIEQDYEFLVQQYKDGPRSQIHRRWFRRFPSPAGTDSPAITPLKVQLSSLTSPKRTCIRKHNQSWQTY